MAQRAHALVTLEQAIARAGGAKVMLRLEEALEICAALRGEGGPVCALHGQGLACTCRLLDPDCEHRRAG